MFFYSILGFKKKKIPLLFSVKQVSGVFVFANFF